MSGRRASILQTKFAFHLFQRIGPRPPGPVVDQPLPGQIQVFQIVEMRQNGFAGVEGLGPARRPGEPFKMAFYVFGQPTGAWPNWCGSSMLTRRDTIPSRCHLPAL